MLSKRISLGFVLPYLTLISFLKGIINFEKEVLPILQERCVECHKATHEQNGRLKQPKAGLRLDGAAYIMHGSDGGPVVVVDHPLQLVEDLSRGFGRTVVLFVGQTLNGVCLAYAY